MDVFIVCTGSNYQSDGDVCHVASTAEGALGYVNGNRQTFKGRDFIEIWQLRVDDAAPGRQVASWEAGALRSEQPLALPGAGDQ